jgi:hypothetical protein
MRHVPVPGSRHRSFVQASPSSQSASTVHPFWNVAVVVVVEVVVNVVMTKLVAVHDVEVVVDVWAWASPALASTRLATNGPHPRRMGRLTIETLLARAVTVNGQCVEASGRL